MKKIVRFDRWFARQARQTAEQILRTNLAQYGLSIKVGNGRFTSDTLRFRVELLVDGASERMEREAAERFGLSDNLIGKTVTIAGVEYRVTRFNPSARKYPIIVRNPMNGRSYRITKAQLREGLQNA